MSFARFWATPTTATRRQREQESRCDSASRLRESKRQSVRITPEDRMCEMTAVCCRLLLTTIRSSIDGSCRSDRDSREAATGNSLGRGPQEEECRNSDRAAKRRQMSVSRRGHLGTSHAAASRLSGTWDGFSWRLHLLMLRVDLECGRWSPLSLSVDEDSVQRRRRFCHDDDRRITESGRLSPLGIAAKRKAVTSHRTPNVQLQDLRPWLVRVATSRLSLLPMRRDKVAELAAGRMRGSRT